MTWEINPVQKVVDELYQSKQNWEAVRLKLDETSNELLIYVWFDCKVQKSWNETKEKNKYRSTFSRKKRALPQVCHLRKLITLMSILQTDQNSEMNLNSGKKML